MKTLWDESVRGEVRRRSRQLTGAHTAQWGKMNSQQMLAHVVEALKAAVGEITVGLKKTPFRFFPLKQLFLYVLPVPKGIPTMPEFQPSSPAEIDRSREELMRLLDVFAARDRKGLWPPHAAFGPLSSRAWGVLAYKHLDHHLRQFGV